MTLWVVQNASAARKHQRIDCAERCSRPVAVNSDPVCASTEVMPENVVIVTVRPPMMVEAKIDSRSHRLEMATALTPWTMPATHIAAAVGASSSR